MSETVRPTAGASVAGPAYRKAVLELLGDSDPFAVQQTLRERNLRLLRSLGAEERGRAGIHSVRGRETIEDIIKLTAGHDLVHRRQIDRIKQTVAE